MASKKYNKDQIKVLLYFFDVKMEIEDAGYSPEDAGLEDEKEDHPDEAIQRIKFIHEPTGQVHFDVGEWESEIDMYDSAKFGDRLNNAMEVFQASSN